MAAPTLVKRFTSIPSFPSNYLLLPHQSFYKKTTLCSSFFGANSLNILNYGVKTSKLVNNTKRKMCAVASLGGLLGGIFKGTDTGESTRKQYAQTVSLINQLEAEMSALSDSQLRDKTGALKERARIGESLDLLLPVRAFFSPFSFLLYTYLNLILGLFWSFEIGWIEIVAIT